MKAIPLFFVVVSLLVLGDGANGMEQKLEFHEKVKSVIDEQENARYNIFGEIEGFTAARLLTLSDVRADILFLRNFEGRAQAVHVNVPAKSFDQLRVSLANRIMNAPDREFNFALLPVDAKEWEESSTNKRIILKDGSQLLGALRRAQGDTLIVMTHGGLEIPVPSVKIAYVKTDGGGSFSGRFYRIDPNTSRLFFAPTGRRLKSGSGYFADYWIFFPTAAFGITDNFSLAGGMSLLPGADSQLFYLMPKLTFELSENAGVGTGLMYMGLPGEGEGFTLGYAVTTFGQSTKGLTVGAGVPFSSEFDAVILLLGGEVQTSNSAKFITENWIFLGGEESTILLSGGIRFFGDRMAVDLALITAPEAWGEGGFPFFPWVDFSVFWGK